MPRGRKDISKDGVKFSKENQPTPEAKSKGKRRIKDIRHALEFIGQQLKARTKDNEGGIVELSREAAIVNKLYEMAETGDIRAIETLAKLGGWYAEKNQRTILAGLEYDEVWED